VTANGLRHLTRDECLFLLGREQLGRVSVSIDVLPAMLPMNYALMDGAIVLRTAPGTKLTASLIRGVVGFEVDRVDTDNTNGWSVLAFGHPSEIHDDATLDHAHELPLTSWAPGERDHFIKTPVERVSGRTFGSVLNFNDPS
jgi:uncharacterized protein